MREKVASASKLSPRATQAREPSAGPASREIPTFNVGDTLVHPAHGVGSITAIEEKLVGSEPCELYVIRVHATGMRVMVPKAAVDRVGLRKVMSAREADEILQILTLPDVAVRSQPWNRRFRAYTEMLASGAAVEIAKVLRDMQRRSAASELSFGERRLLDQAKALLIQELALAKNRPADELELEIVSMFAA
ncbi:MAG: hypothetical protein B6A08_01740 [Sorangiineae bacterium NIC37A_2]|jgi:CarD family transcriptional regulator|nr:MAG: hypothetical protein B6A08_01740 [Sorangiineae bacterium NIC37A_2]